LVSGGIKSDFGIPIKILDGYLVRGDMLLEMGVGNATVNGYASADLAIQAAGTFIWGYYQRVGTDDSWRFIGEPAAGPKFDTGLPIIISAGQRKIVHTFETNRFDELALQVINPAPYLPPTDSALFLSFADANQVDIPHTSAIYLNAMDILGGPNNLRDPQSVYGFTGVFGGNAQLKYLMIQNLVGYGPGAPLFIHGRFNRH
jgi:hypothetical protein